MSHTHLRWNFAQYRAQHRHYVVINCTFEAYFLRYSLWFSSFYSSSSPSSSSSLFFIIHSMRKQRHLRPLLLTVAPLLLLQLLYNFNSSSYLLYCWWQSNKQTFSTFRIPHHPNRKPYWMEWIVICMWFLRFHLTFSFDFGEQKQHEPKEIVRTLCALENSILASQEHIKNAFVMMMFQSKHIHKLVLLARKMKVKLMNAFWTVTKE